MAWSLLHQVVPDKQQSISEEKILHMPLARLAQYQHCLLRRNGVRTGWAASQCEISAKVALRVLKKQHL